MRAHGTPTFTASPSSTESFCAPGKLSNISFVLKKNPKHVLDIGMMASAQYLLIAP